MVVYNDSALTFDGLHGDFNGTSSSVAAVTTSSSRSMSGVLNISTGLFVMGEYPGSMMPAEGVTMPITAAHNSATGVFTVVGYVPRFAMLKEMVLWGVKLTLSMDTLSLLGENDLVMNGVLQGTIDLAKSAAAAIPTMPEVEAMTITNFVLARDDAGEIQPPDPFTVEVTSETDASLSIGDGNAGSMLAKMTIPVGIGLPCKEVITGIVGSVEIDLIFLQINTDTRNMSMTCGELKPDDSERFSVSAKGLSMQLFSDKYAGILAHIVSQLSANGILLPKLDMDLVVRFGANGWYYDVLLEWGIERDVNAMVDDLGLGGSALASEDARQFSMSAEIVFTTKYGFPVEANVTVVVRLTLPGVMLGAHANFKLGPSCEPGVGFRFEAEGQFVFGQMQMPGSDDPSFFPDAVDVKGSLTRYCPDYLQNTLHVGRLSAGNVTIVEGVTLIEAFVEIRITTYVSGGISIVAGELHGEVEVDFRALLLGIGIPESLLNADFKYDLSMTLTFEWQQTVFDAFLLAVIDFEMGSEMVLEPQGGLPSTTSIVNVTGHAEASFPCKLGHSFKGNVSIDFEMIRNDKHLFKTDEAMTAYFVLYCGDVEAGNRLFELEVEVPSVSLTLQSVEIAVTDFKFYATGWGMDNITADATTVIEASEVPDWANQTDFNGTNGSAAALGMPGENFLSEETNEFVRYYDGRDFALSGMISGKLAASVGEVGLGSAATFFFDTRDGSFTASTMFYFTSQFLNLTLEIGAESKNRCSYKGNYVKGTFSLADGISSGGVGEATSAPVQGVVSGTKWCGDPAREGMAFELILTVSDYSIALGDGSGLAEALEISRASALFVGMLRDDADADADWGPTDLDWNMTFSGSAHLLGGAHASTINSIGSMSLTVGVTILDGGFTLDKLDIKLLVDYVLPAEPGTWQADEAVDPVSIKGTLDIHYPCPPDGVMIDGFVGVDVYTDYVNITGSMGMLGRNFGLFSYNCHTKTVKLYVTLDSVKVGRYDVPDYFITLDAVRVNLTMGFGKARPSVEATTDDLMNGTNVSASALREEEFLIAEKTYVTGSIQGLFQTKDGGKEMTRLNASEMDGSNRPGLMVEAVVIFDTRDWTQLDITAKLTYRWINKDGL